MISDYLSPAERLACIKCGALLVAAERDTAAESEPAVKSAGVGSAVASGLKTVDSAALLIATVLGIPVGVGAHALMNSVDGKRFEEEKVIRKAQMLRDAAEDMRRGITR